MNTIKKLNALLLLLFCSFLINAGVPSDTDFMCVNGIYYRTIEGNNVCVTYKDMQYNSYSGTVSIPLQWAGDGDYNIVAVGKCAFKDCPNLYQVYMCKNILTIDSCAFQNCTGMGSVDGFSGLKTIGNFAFENCSSIVFFSIPNSVTSIGEYVFKDCTSLRQVSFYNDKTTLTVIPKGMFSGCKSFEYYKMPNTITTVCDEAFRGTGIKELTLNKTLTTIGESAYRDCHNLSELQIAEGTQTLTIGNNAFDGCTSLKSIITNALVPPVLTNGLGLTQEQLDTLILFVPRLAYDAYCQAEYWKDFAHIEKTNYDFASNDNNYGQIYYNIIGDDEVCITCRDSNYNSYQGTYYDSFEGGRGMGIPDNVTYNGKNYRVTAIGENAFRDCTGIDLIDWVNKDRIKSIGPNAFKGCSNLRYVNLPQKIETIGAHAFEGCIKIPTMWFRESVNLIDTCAFMGCSGLKAIEFKSSMRLGPKAFSGTNLRGYDLTKGVAIFCSLWTPPVLADSTVFDSTHYANSVIKVPYSRVEHYRNTENWGRFTNIRRMPYDFKEGNIYYRINNENEVGVSPDNELFYGSYSGNVNIPETVLFEGKTYQVTSIERAAFYFCDISSVTVSNSVKRIGDLAFAKSFVGTVILGDSVETIGYGAFNESLLKKINFPKSVKHIGDSALVNTPSLSTITVDPDNPYYDSREDCNALIETANNRLIAGGSKCTEIPSSVTSITDFAFYAKDGLSRITIPGSIHRIGNHVFVFCENLSQVTFSEPLESIGVMAFGFTGLTSVVIPNSVDTIQEAAFGGSSKIKKVTLGSELKLIGQEAFSPGSAQTSIDTVVCYATTPPVMENINCFNGAYGRATLFVPQASLELYKNDPNWSQFYKIVAVESSGINEISVDDGTPWERYNLQGLPVADDYRGIVIENGKKILKP